MKIINQQFFKLLTIALLLSTFAMPLTAKNKSAKPALEFKSAKPMFGKLVLSQDGSKTLGIAFDESQGTGTRYDTAYIFDGSIKDQITRFIKIKSTSSSKQGTQTCSFEKTRVPIAFNQHSKDVNDPWILKFLTTRTKVESVLKENRKKRKIVTITDEYKVLATLNLKDQNDDLWSYTFNVDLNPSFKLGVARAIKFNQKPDISIETKRLDPKDRKIGINLDVLCAGKPFSCDKNNGDTYIDIEFINDKGNVVKKDRNRVNKFNYEVAEKSISCGPGG